MKKHTNKTRQTAPRVQEEDKTYYAEYGKAGKTIKVECVKENGKYVGVHGETIPEWATITEG